MDSGRFGVKKCKVSDPRGTPKAQNIGRSLVMVGRFARQWLVKGLPDRGGSSSRLGPETCAEDTPTIDEKMGSATILCPDGASGSKVAAARNYKKKFVAAAGDNLAGGWLAT